MGTILGIKDTTPSTGYTLEKKERFFFVRKKKVIVLYVVANSLLETDESIILNTPGMPQLYSLWHAAYVQGFDLKETGTVLFNGTITQLFEVSVKLDSHFDIDDTESNPVNKNPKVRWTSEEDEELLERDAITGNPVITAAGEQILITTPTVLPVLEIKRFEYFPFNPNVMLTFANRTNSANFWGAPPGSALMLPMDVDEEIIYNEQTESSEKYAVVTYRIKFKIKPGLSQPWQARVLHQGYLYLEEPGAEPIAATDKNGNPITVNLHADGTKFIRVGGEEYLQFNRFSQADFNVLWLGPF